MKKWLHDRPWVWIVLLLGFLVVSGMVVVVIAELNRPEIVKEKRTALQVDSGLSAAARFAIAIAC